MFIHPDDRAANRTPSQLDVGSGPTDESNHVLGNAPLECLLALMTSTEPAPIDALAFGKRAGEIIAKARSTHLHRADQ
jgi:hypothetical protein